MKSLSIEEQVTLLMQGADFGDEQIKENMRKELFERLRESEKSGRPLRVYCGYDPTAPDIHLGHTVTMRKLQEVFGQRSQVCLTFPILVGTDGVLRMSKSTGNYIGIDESPEDKYGKAMSIPDSAMRNWFELVTRWRPGQINELLRSVEMEELHPMEAKKKLAGEIVAMLEGNEAADRAAAHFAVVHQARQQPREMASRILAGPIGVVELIFEAGFASSKSRARRLIQQGAVRFNDDRINDLEAKIGGLGVLQVGKRHFLKLL